MGEEGAGSGIRKVSGRGRIRGKLRNIAKSPNRREPTKMGWEPGLKVTGSRKFKPPCPPHDSFIVTKQWWTFPYKRSI